MAANPVVFPGMKLLTGKQQTVFSPRGVLQNKGSTAIDFDSDGTTVTYTVADEKTGQPDLIFSADKLTDLSTDGEIVTNSFTNLNHDEELTYGYAKSRLMSYATSTDEANVRLTLGNGHLSDFIRSLDIGAMLKYEYIADFQSALYAPQPLSATDE